MSIGNQNFKEVEAIDVLKAVTLGSVVGTNIEDPTGLLNDLTLTSSAETTTGIVTAGKKSVMFTCEDGTEKVNGVTRKANQVIVFEWYNRRTPAITWDANGGTIQIDIFE